MKRHRPNPKIKALSPDMGANYIKTTITHAPQELEILFHLHKIQYEEANFRRTREMNIFLWSSSIFVAIIALLIAVDQTKTVLWKAFGIWGKLIATSVILFFAVFSIVWQHRERRFENEQKRLIAKINRLLFVFEEGFYGLGKNETLYPNEKRWTNWGEASLKSPKRYFRGNPITATWILALLAIVTVWLAK